MDLRPITDKQKIAYNQLVTHVIQSWQWGEFRKSLGIPVLRYGIYHNSKLSTAFQLTLHKIPFTSQYVGYLPKGPYPDQQLAEALKKIGQENNCAFIKIEPDIINPSSVIASEIETSTERGNPPIPLKIASSMTPRNDNTLISKDFILSPKPLFTKYNFILDLTKSEDQLLKNMHPKTRYNIKVAQKHGVKVEERSDDKAFKIYLKLYFETTKRQGYFGHNANYHQQVWQKLHAANMARLLIAFFRPPTSDIRHPITTWMLLNFKDTLYYPYGGSARTHPEVMANNLVAWETIKLGKKLGLKKFDMWGALGPNADPKDPWYGFHKFKQGYGGQLVEYLGTYDLVFNWPLYWIFTLIDKIAPVKIFLLKLLRK